MLASRGARPWPTEPSLAVSSPASPGNPRAMAVLGWLWLVSPFVVIGVIWHDQGLRELITLHYRRCLTVGWTGAVMMLLGVMVVPGALGSVMFVLGTPLAGLVVWLRPDDGDDGDDDGPEPPPINWDEFERSFWAYVRRRGSRPRPRTPSPV